MKESHLTVRLPTELARALARWAKRTGVPKSQVAREAVARYLAPVGSVGPAPSRPTLTARALAARWTSMPRLESDDAASFGADLLAGRQALPGLGDPWP